jgi:Putative esterase
MRGEAAVIPSGGCKAKGAAYGLACLTLLISTLSAHAESGSAERSRGPRFEIALPASSHPQPVTGRLFLMISHHNDPEVRLQSTWFNSPEIVGIDVAGLMPGHSVVVDDKALGTPLCSLKELPPGDYYIQAVLNVYTEFHRADGRTIWAHMDQWEGQQFNKSPGNPFSQVVKVHLDASRGDPIRLGLTEVIPPLPSPADTEWVKYIRFQSRLLTQFWGRPIYIGAVVLLPRDYHSRPDTQYPVLYSPAGHFSLAAPFGFRTDNPPETPNARAARESIGYESGYEFYRSWQSDDLPRMLLVSLLDPTPFSDWSGGVNSENNGPYGDAILTELIPYVEEHFRIIRESYARVLTGNASGGREALALQVYHPDFFGGAWIFQPWPFNFQRYSQLDLYENENAFEIKPTDLPQWARPVSEWLPLERYMGRLADGTPFVTFRQLSQHDAVMAGMAGGDPIGADDAILGPVGDRGYPQPLWDRRTGRIDPEVAEYWHARDLAVYAEHNWDNIGPRLLGKLHFYVGENDHFYRNEGVHAFENSLQASQQPLYGTTFEYAPLKGDWQPMTNAGLIRILAAHIVQNAPHESEQDMATQLRIRH